MICHSATQYRIAAFFCVRLLERSHDHVDAREFLNLLLTAGAEFLESSG
jgi:hypothetical protein